MRGPAEAFEVFRDAANVPQEVFIAAYLDSRHRVLMVQVISLGTIDATLVHPREVFRPAIKIGAAALIVAHNHPSGDAHASREDRELTKRLSQVGALVGIQLLDHMIVTADGYVSLQEESAELFTEGGAQ